MPTNIEIKARIRDWNRVQMLAEALSDQPFEVLEQEDTFFASPKGRLKLRQFPDGRGELISYRREDIAGTKASCYLITKTDEPDQLRQVLADALDNVGTVKKRRYLYLV